MKVSICVPVYGVEKYIQQCVVSLFSQTYKDIEYIFVDDCSKDKSIDIINKVLEKYPTRRECVKIIHHVKNTGLAGARNTAIDNATGEYVLHVDSDDWLDIDAVEVLVRIAIKEKADFVSFPTIRESKEGSDVIVQPFLQSKFNTLNLILADSDFIPHHLWANFIRLSLYNDNKIRAKQGVNQSEDYSVMPLLFYMAQTPFYTTKIYYHYRADNENSYMHNITPDSVKQAMEATLMVTEFFEKNKEISKFENAICIAKMNTINNSIKNGFQYRKFMPKHFFVTKYLSFPYNILFWIYYLTLSFNSWSISRGITKAYSKFFRYENTKDN